MGLRRKLKYDFTKALREVEDGKSIELNFQYAPIEARSKEYFEGKVLKGLEVIRCENMGLEEVPDVFALFPHLKVLLLSGNKLKKIPNSIAQLQKLEVLDLSHNPIENFPKVILQLLNLQYLGIDVEALHNVPDEIEKLRYLKGLNLVRHPFHYENGKLTFPLRSSSPKEVIPFEINILKFRQLEELDISSNGFTDIPDSIEVLQNLKILHCWYNHFTQFPKAICRLRNLKRLQMGDQPFSDIPDELSNLVNLERLMLMRCKISELSVALWELPCLRELSIVANRIKYLPASLLDLRNIQKHRTYLGYQLTFFNFDFRENPIENIPPEVVRGGYDTIKNYFQELQVRGAVSFDAAKILVVGKGGTGKTSLVKRMQMPRSGLDSRQGSTEGIDIRNWNIKLEDGRQIACKVWDFGGQEIYHSTHQFFLTQRSLYLFVWDARQEQDYLNFDYWLNAIQMFGKDSPVIVVMNKADIRRKAINERYYQEHFPNIKGFYQVSCYNGEGIDTLIEAIKTELSTLEHIDDQVPTVWKDIQNELSQMNANHIAFDDYLDICDEYDVDEEKADFLVRYLHELGTVLHFANNKQLKDDLILNPEWVTQAVYKILDDETTQQAGGRFTESQLRKIWNRQDYGRRERTMLLALMQQFKICFQPVSSNQFVVSELLHPQQPENFEWDKRDNLHFEYHYAFMPKGIINELLTVCLPYLSGEMFWKHGFVLQHKTCEILVVEDVLYKRILVRVNGDEKEDTLGFIQQVFSKIHTTFGFKRMKVNDVVPDKPRRQLQVAIREMVACNCSVCEQRAFPHLYEYRILKKHQEHQHEQMLCDISSEAVDILQLLGVIEMGRTRNRYLMNREPLKIFMAYALEDQKEVKAFEKQLSVLEQNGSIRIWSPHEHVRTGKNRIEVLERELRDAQLFLIMVSSDLFFGEKELIDRILEEKQTPIVPILLKHCMYDISELGELQALPKDKTFIFDGSVNPDKLMLGVVRDLVEQVDELRLV